MTPKVLWGHFLFQNHVIISKFGDQLSDSTTVLEDQLEIIILNFARDQFYDAAKLAGQLLGI